jgi:hypothetical protein
MRLNNPAPGRPVTSPYGWRIHPITKRKAFHRGTDFGGTFDVLAAGDGTVVNKGANMNKKTGGGHTVTIKHDADLYTVYYHGAQATHLKVGDSVKAGEKFIYLVQLVPALGHTSTSRFAQNKLGGQTPTQHPILKNKNPAKLRLMANWVSKRGVQSRNILKKSVIMKVVWTGAPEDSLFPVFNEP